MGDHECWRHRDSVRCQEVGDPGHTILVQILRPGIRRIFCLVTSIFVVALRPCEATARKSFDLSSLSAAKARVCGAEWGYFPCSSGVAGCFGLSTAPTNK